MQPFVWDDHYTTGLDSVDRQHHRLVELINRLGDSLVGSGTSEDELKAVFAELADYARFHFADEERLMLESRIDDRHREPHCRRHQEFVDQVTMIWNARQSIRDPVEALHGFLCAWLAFHILGEDQAMARQIRRVQAGESPQEAFEQDKVAVDGPTDALLGALQRLYHVLSLQNRDLATANTSLEQRVAERTERLAAANRELVELTRKLEALSNQDGLLGIANRRYFDGRLDAEWRRAARAGAPLSLLMIDVDHFKQYNDLHGHQQGDTCLQTIARVISEKVRRGGDLVARYGGEEIVALMPETAHHDAMRVAEGVRQAVADAHIAHGRSPVSDRVTVSIGVATLLPDRAADAAALVAAADAALYRAKQSGRDRVCSAELAPA